MAWNEPSNNGKDQKDPWTGKPRNEQGPPNLEEVLRKLHERLTASISKARGDKNGRGGSPQDNEATFQLGFFLILGIILLIWFFSGFFIVDPAERAVILRLGKYAKTVGPGPHWIPRFIESVYVVNEQKISTYSYDSQMLTQDANIVSVAIAVQYRIANAKDYLFNVVNPQESLQQATASALRQVIGRTALDSVLTSGRDKVRQDVLTILNQTLSRYNTGLLITDVAMQPAKAPDEVKEAFDDAIKAQEDEQRFQNQAQAYAMQVEPTAQGQAQRLLADAQAYKQQVVLHAKGEVASYLALLPQYLSATDLTRQRLYLDTMESVLSKTTKILLDVNGSNNMFYLPLDKIMQKQEEITPVVSGQETPATTQTAISATPTEAPTRNSYPTTGGYE